MSDMRNMPSSRRAPGLSVPALSIAMLAIAVLPACAGVHVGDDAGQDDASAAPMDASVVDGSRPDARALDAPTADAGTDGFIALDAWRAAERCNGLDEDEDELVDEGADLECRSAPGGRYALCAGGSCQCRPDGTLPHPGAFADCNADWSDGCETSLRLRTSCGACGVVCDAVSECTDTDMGGLRCRPMRILDFSVSRRDGEITCLVGIDGRVLCRGPNTEHAISDVESESSVLDWTVVDMPAAREVRANLRTREDGTDVLSICIVTPDGGVVCRGDNGTGLLGYGDRVARPGNHVIALPETIYRLEIRGGDAYAMYGSDTTRMTLWRWGGDDAMVPASWLSDVVHFALANMPVATTLVPDPDAPVWDPRVDASTQSWGTHRDRLANQDDGTAPWPNATPFMGPVGPIACERDVCCFTSPGYFVTCWGRDTAWHESPTQPIGGYAHMTGDGIHPSYLRADVRDPALRDDIRMAPTPGGGLEVCIGRPVPAALVSAYAGVALWCADARELAEAPTSNFDDRLRPEVDRYSADGRAARSRADWDAMCLDITPNQWRCWGMHEGWGYPPVP